jgi:hypothetical protein
MIKEFSYLVAKEKKELEKRRKEELLQDKA